MLHLKFIVEPISNGYIVECRGHSTSGERELVYAADEAAAKDVVVAAAEAWAPRALAAKNAPSS